MSASALSLASVVELWAASELTRRVLTVDKDAEILAAVPDVLAVAV